MLGAGAGSVSATAAALVNSLMTFASFMHTSRSPFGEDIRSM